MNRRFFASTPITADDYQLSGDEAHHLSRVLRAAAGDEVILFDDTGYEFRARVLQIARQTVNLQILERQLVDRELPRPLHVAVALPKGDRQKWLVEKAVELGVTALVPLRTQFGVAQPTAEALERIRRQVLEASKQCARNRLMQVAAPLSCDEFCALAPPDALRWITHPYQAIPIRRSLAVLPRATSVYAMVGPEGGWSDDELTAAACHGWSRVALGQRILRVETAACALASIVAAWMEDQPS